MRTSLLIGLGGSGDWILTFLKSKFLAKKGDASTFPEASFRLFDTLAANRREAALANEEYTYTVNTAEGERKEKIAHVGKARLENNEYHDLIPDHNLRDKAVDIRDGQMPFLNWFQANYYLRTLGAFAWTLETGAGQWRQFGRIGLVSVSNNNAARVPQVVRGQMQDLKAYLGEGDALDVFVVCSLAGGTGAGTFIDTAILARNLAKQVNLNINLYGMLVLPGAFDAVAGADIEPARSYAAFLELDRLQSVFGRATPFSVQYGNDMKLDLDVKLYDCVYLLDAPGAMGHNAQPEEGLFPAIADGMELFMDPVSGYMIANQTANAIAEYAARNPGQFVPALYSSFGSWKILLPARLYTNKFAHNILMKYLEELVPHQNAEGIKELIDGQGGADYGQLAEDFLRDNLPVLVDFLSNLPSKTEADIPQLAATLNISKLLDNYFSPLGVKVNADAKKVLRKKLFTEKDKSGKHKGVRYGELSGWKSDRAIDHVLEKCDDLHKEYFGTEGEFTKTLDEVLDDAARALVDRIDEKLEPVLQGGEVASARKGTLGRLEKLLAHLDTLLLELNKEVMEGVAREINEQKGTESDKETLVNQKRQEMEGTRGYDGGALARKGKKKSWKAQYAYLEAYENLVERQRFQRLIQGLQDMVHRVKARFNQWKVEVDRWANELVLGRGLESGYVYKQSQDMVSSVEQSLQEMGRSYTSSIGMSVWNGRDAVVDTTMGGYEDVLYGKSILTQSGQNLDEHWLDQTSWVVELPNNPKWEGKKYEVTPPPDFKLQVEERTMERANIGNELTSIAFNKIDGVMGKESVLDYLATNVQEADMARLFAENVSPMLQIDDNAGDRTPYLVYKNKAAHDTYLQNLKVEIGNTGVFGPANAIKVLQDYDDAYTLTMAVIANMIPMERVTAMNTSGSRYWQEMADTEPEDALQALQFHCFRCEQEASRVCKFHYNFRQDYTHARMLAPAAYGILEKPELVKAFLLAWSWRLIVKDFSVKAGDDIWCLSLETPAVVGGRPDLDRIFTGEDSGMVMEKKTDGHDPSMLDAMNHFIFKGTCKVRPRIKVDLKDLQRCLSGIEARILDEQAQANADGSGREKRNAFYRTMADHYQEWADTCFQLPDEWPDNCPNDERWADLLGLDNEREEQSLRIICHYYFSKEAENWRNRVK